MAAGTELTYLTPRIWRGAIDGILSGEDDASRFSIVHWLHAAAQHHGLSIALIFAGDRADRRDRIGWSLHVSEDALGCWCQ